MVYRAFRQAPFIRTSRLVRSRRPPPCHPPQQCRPSLRTLSLKVGQTRRHSFQWLSNSSNYGRNSILGCSSSTRPLQCHRGRLLRPATEDPAGYQALLAAMLGQEAVWRVARAAVCRITTRHSSKIIMINSASCPVPFSPLLDIEPRWS